MTQPVPEAELQVPEGVPPGFTALAAVEAAIAAEVLAAFAAWATVAAAAVNAPFTFFTLTPDPSALWSTLPQWEQHVDRIITRLEAIARRGWEDASQQLGTFIPFNVSDPLVQAQLQQTRNLLVRIPDEIYRMILDSLNAGVAAGENNKQLAARVNRILTVTGSENWASRARTVAVTEVNRAYNMGAVALGQRADAADPRVLTKRWDSREDSRTRAAHVAADGQTVPVFQPYMVDREQLMSPGDPSGSAHNVINCRCRQHFAWRNSGR